jgi:hypothetical protein
VASPYRIDVTMVKTEPGFCVTSGPITMVTHEKTKGKWGWIAIDVTSGSPWSPFFRGVTREYYDGPLHDVGTSLDNT